MLADCCQMRGTPSHIAEMLDGGFLVAVTGSKFFCGPPFCGALLLPEAFRARLGNLRLPEGLAAQTAFYDWPAPLRDGSEGFGSHANIGLGLRWEAALAEMDAFRAVPPALAENIAWNSARSRSQARMKPACDSSTSSEESGQGADWARTIVPIAAPGSAQQAADLQRALRRPAGAWGNAARIFHIGQPVAVGPDRPCASPRRPGCQRHRRALRLGRSVRARAQPPGRRPFGPVRQMEILVERASMTGARMRESVLRFSISNSGPATASAPLIGLAAITRYAMQGGDFAPVVSQLVARIERDGADASAWLDLSTIQQVLGNSANRMALQADALRRARHFTHARPGAAPLRLLVLMAPGDFMANTPLEFLLEQGENRARRALSVTGQATA